MTGRLWRGGMVFGGLMLLWGLASRSGIPHFLLPSPLAVAEALWVNRAYLGWHTLITLSEILSGLALGVTLGVTLALGMILSPRLQRWLMPLVLTSQAIPVFALAPLLVLWLGFGMSAKVAMAVLVIFFPVTSAFFDGLRRVNQEYLDLARSMNASSLWVNRAYLGWHTLITLSEILSGLALGVTLGVTLALGMILSPRLQRWLMPLVLTSQAIPVFALAPLLVLWLGFGMSAKVAMAVLVIFFPVTSAFFDGLRRVNQEYLDLARSMNASFGAQLRHVRLMAALPALGSGLRMAAAVAPIGAIIGEWIGSAEGLGYVMLNANARLQTDICFAALFILVLLTLLLWLAVDTLLHRLIDWSPE